MTNLDEMVINFLDGSLNVLIKCSIKPLDCLGYKIPRKKLKDYDANFFPLCRQSSSHIVFSSLV
jgi:hypothetical protein